MQSNISIRLKFKCIIGLLDFERHKKQRVIVKLKARADGFLDYAKCAKIIKKSYKKNKFKTIEESLEKTGIKLKSKFDSLKFLYIKTYKPNIIKNAKVGAKLKRSWKKV